MLRKFKFYDRYGVEEYYLIDPDGHTFDAWQRGKHRLLEVRGNGGVVSPRLGVRFDWRRDADIVMTHPDGKPFLTIEGIAAARDRAEDRAASAETKATALAVKLRELGIDPDAV